MPKVSKAHSDARRRQILKAAYHCFSQKGFQATTTREICREARLSPGAIYSYFSSKDEIIEAVADAKGKPRQELAAAATAEQIEVPEALVRGLESMLTGLTEKGAKQATSFDLRIWSEAISNPKLRRMLLEALGRLHQPWTSAVRRGQENGELNPEIDSAAVAHVLVAIVLGLEVLTVFEKDLDPEHVIRAVRSLISGSFRLPSSPASEETPCAENDAGE